ncbi:hypothetical protein [Quadrisphaera sp. DSM 44207]|uniref:hypothetical protein n=1 Tax=Quadrisphaera sp. DSM 44207 TaxID=1881057 RepID=UPI000B8449AE|nr:hypothetical protein [Quadrisphaera sp. DSM 44207]
MAKDRGVTLAKSSWYDVSGARLHHDTSGAGWDLEPSVGASDAELLTRVLAALVQTASESMWLGHWTGQYHDFPAREGEQVLLGAFKREYRVFPVTRSGVLEHVRGRESSYAQVMGSTLSVAWDELGSWFINFDIDLPSTVVGCTEEAAMLLKADAQLEVVEVDPLDHVIA